MYCLIWKYIVQTYFTNPTKFHIFLSIFALFMHIFCFYHKLKLLNIVLF